MVLTPQTYFVETVLMVFPAWLQVERVSNLPRELVYVAFPDLNNMEDLIKALDVKPTKVSVKQTLWCLSLPPITMGKIRDQLKPLTLNGI